MKPSIDSSKSNLSQFINYITLVFGAFLAAFSIEVFLIPNKLIDGGIIGVSMIFGNIFGYKLIPLFLILLNIPFLYFALRYIGRTFVLKMFIAICVFAVSMVMVANFLPSVKFFGDALEVVVIGGAILGIGIGLVIRVGGCLDGTEILAIILSEKKGFTVGQVVLLCNVVIFSAAGIVFQDWHPPILSLITYMVAVKVMDTVIVGLDETKSVIIISRESKKLTEEIIHKLGLGLTIMYGRGGFSGVDQEILYVIAERLQLAELKALTYSIDANAFIAIENLHEVSNGSLNRYAPVKSKRIKKLVDKMLKGKNKKG
jgi:uncharacterized membrane-anchored protein YitT (DUF2179 family)